MGSFDTKARAYLIVAVQHDLVPQLAVSNGCWAGAFVARAGGMTREPAPPSGQPLLRQACNRLKLRILVQERGATLERGSGDPGIGK
jgi:hypothetical protein